MIIRNGYIEYITTTNGGIDENGYPTGGVATYGVPIPCQYSFSRNNRSMSNGEHMVRESYSILVEFNKEPKTERIRLTRLNGEVIGEYSIISNEPLRAVCQERILV